jgi:O-antigen/teichoic acid export membrane protein
VVPKFFGITATLIAAFIHPSYTALLYGIATNQALRSAMSYVMHPFRPRFSLRAWRGLIGYSLWTWLLSLAILLRNRSDTLLLGRLTNSTSVGVYAIGSEVASLPTSELVEPLCRASFAGFAAANREGVSVTETFLRLMSSAVIVTLPAGLGLALVAAPLVRLAFGPGWDAAIPVLRVLGLAGIMTVFGQISLHLMSAYSLLGRLTAVALAGAALRIVLLLLLIPPFGVAGAAWAAAAATCADQGATLVMALRHSRVGFRTFVSHIVRPVLAACLMACAVLAIGPWLPDGDVTASLLVEVALGAVIYTTALLVCWLLAGRPDGPEADAVQALRRTVARA